MYVLESINHFIGELWMDGVELTVDVVDDLSCRARVGITRTNGGVDSIILQINSKIGGSELREVVEHEMVHIMTELRHDENQGHNINFVQTAKAMCISLNKKYTCGNYDNVGGVHDRNRKGV